MLFAFWIYTPRVVASMTTDGPGNSINQMEQYILKEYPDEQSCYHMSIIKHSHSSPTLGNHINNSMQRKHC